MQPYLEAYLDIETTGLSPGYCEITVIGIHICDGVNAGFTQLSQFVGPTRFSREILRRAPIALLLPVLTTLDRWTFRSQRVSDTWILVTSSKE